MLLWWEINGACSDWRRLQCLVEAINVAAKQGYHSRNTKVETYTFNWRQDISFVQQCPLFKCAPCSTVPLVQMCPLLPYVQELLPGWTLTSFKFRLQYSGLWHLAVSYLIVVVSEETAACIFRVEYGDSTCLRNIVISQKSAVFYQSYS